MVKRPPTGTIPESPGSYQFKDAQGRVIYVGKAASLRSRLSNYFADPRSMHPRTAQMVATADTVEWIEVRNEVEALMLEYSLIKQHRPRFNIRLRDDKSYPFLALTMDEQWPRAMVMRGRRRKGVRYFGPYAHAYAIREQLDLLLSTFPIRTCSTGWPRCSGPSSASRWWPSAARTSMSSASPTTTSKPPCRCSTCAKAGSSAARDSSWTRSRTSRPPASCRASWKTCTATSRRSAS